MQNNYYNLDNGVDGEVFFSLNKEDLEQLIPNFGLRKKLTIRLPQCHPLAPTVIQKINQNQVNYV